MDNSRVGEAEANSEASRWKAVLFRQRIVKEIAKAIVVNWPQAVKGSTTIIMGIAERIEANVFASAKHEADYNLKIRNWIRSLDPSSMVARRKPSATSCNPSQAASSSESNERVAGVDWQEVLYQEVQMLRSNFLPILSDIYRCFVSQLPNKTPSEIEKVLAAKRLLEDIFTCLDVTKSQIDPDFKFILDERKRSIRPFIRGHKSYLHKRKNHSTDKCSKKQAIPPQSEEQLTMPSTSLQISHLSEQIPNDNKMNPQVRSAESEQDDPEKLMQQVAKENTKDEIPLSAVTSDQPTPAFQRLVEVVSSLSHKSLSESVREIRDIIRLSDILSAPFKRPKDVICSNSVVDLAADSRAGYSKFGDFLKGDRKIRRSHYAMPLYTASLYASTSESVNQLIDTDDTDTESVSSPQVKCPANECPQGKKTLLEEIKEVKMLLFETKVAFNEADIIPSVAAGTSAQGDGLIVELHFQGITVSSELKSHLLTNQMSIFKPLRLRIPASYPNCSPILLDEMPSEETRAEQADLLTKAKLKLQRYLRSLDDPLSFKSIAMSWEKCVREAICEYAQKFGGGTFSSKYGGWKNV